MRNPRIFSDQPLQAGNTIQLSESAAKHVGRVLRMQPGEPLVLFNGHGGAWQATVDGVSKKAVTVTLQSALDGDAQSPLVIELGQSMSRGERMDYAIQKATEAGVTAITPLWSERCEVKLNADRLDKRVRHWQQVAISACEQCGRNVVPIIHPPQTIGQWLANRTTELGFVLHHRTQQKLSGFRPPQSVSLLIGPEGGLSAAEIALAEHHQFHALALGPRVLRTETAPVVAIALMQYVWGDYA